MIESEFAKLIVVLGVVGTAILLIVFSYGIHILISNRRLNQAQSKMRALTANLCAAQEKERKRIAEDLHDRIGETLVLSNRSLERLKKKLNTQDTSGDFDELYQIIHKLFKGARSLIFELVPPALYDFGLEAALESFASNYRKQHKIDIKVEDDRQPKPLATDTAVFMYKAVCELVSNVIKHARADSVTIRLNKVQDDYRVVVEDNGIGFNSENPAENTNGSKGFGLFNVQVQAEHYGGHLEIGDTFINKGGRVTLSVPLQRNGFHD